MDEPEALAGINLAAREGLDNLTWVINTNLQRLDGPVRGNGKIIQELEAMFRGAGWNVIKVILGIGVGRAPRPRRRRVLVKHDEHHTRRRDQKFAVEDGAYIREHFFGHDLRLRKMVEHLTDDQLRKLPRGGHDYHKIYAAYRAAVDHEGQPTVILAKTIKGWTLGPDVEARTRHQIKKLTGRQLVGLRDRLHLKNEIPDEALTEDQEPPYFRPDVDSPEFQYLMERRRSLGGSVPVRSRTIHRAIELPGVEPFAEFDEGSGTQSFSTTMAFTRLLRNLARHETFGSRVVPIIPDEGRTFGMDGLFKELRIYAPFGQRYVPVDAGLMLSYEEGTDGQILEEGITEAGAVASWTAAATAYATRGVPMVPFFIFYSMFGFQRVGDFLWAAADAESSRIPDGCHCRADHASRRGPPAPGRPQPPPRLDDPDLRGLRPGVRLRTRRHHRARNPADVRRGWRGRLLLPDRLQRELPPAAEARRRWDGHHRRPLQVGSVTRRV